jgi:phage protein D
MPEGATLAIRLNGRQLSRDALAGVLAMSVTEDLAVTSVCTLELVNWDSRSLRLSWSESPLFRPGAELDVWMQSGGISRRVFLGEIVGVDVMFQTEQVPRVAFRAFDHRHRLARATRTRSFSKVKDSDIARLLAQDAGLVAEVTDTRITLDYVLQRNQSDLAFLTDRARRLGYEVFVRDKRLLFRPPRYDLAPTSVLDVSTDLLELSTRYSTVGQVSEVQVSGWNVADKEPYVVKAREFRQGQVGTGASGPGVARKAFGTVVVQNADLHPQSAAEATELAMAEYEQRGLAFAHAEGRAHGRSELRAGTTLGIRGAGHTFSGDYYLTAVTHSYDLDDGYVTEFAGQKAII